MNNKKMYNKSEIMRRAWVIFRKDEETTFSDALKQSWNIAKNGTAKPTFNKVYSENYSKVLSYVKYKVKNSEIAEEITQDVFLKVNEHFEKYDVYKAKITTWLFTIANRKIIDHYRRDKSNLLVHVDGFVNDEGKESFEFESSYSQSGIEEKELYGSIEQAMQTLNSKEQDIAQLYFIQDLPYNEISEMLDVPMGTVKGLINRIRGKLQTKLQKEYKQLHS